MYIIRKIVIATGQVSTIAGTAGTFGSTDGVGASARFGYAQGVTCDGTNLYVADSYSHTIRTIVLATGEVTTLAGTAGTPGSTDSTGSGASFNNPQGITSNGRMLYVADSSNNTIRRIQ
jgi:DNA-binding beta-propeller fold protein YncE